MYSHRYSFFDLCSWPVARGLPFSGDVGRFIHAFLWLKPPSERDAIKRAKYQWAEKLITY